MPKKFNFREFILNHISKLPLIVIFEITIMLTVSVNISVLPLYNMAVERELNRSEDVKKGIKSTINDELYKISNIIELVAADKQIPLQVHNAFVKDEYNELRESMHIYQRGGRLSFIELVDQDKKIAFSSGLTGRFSKEVSSWDIIKNNTVERPAYGITKIEDRIFLVSANTIIHMAEPIATIIGGIEINDIFSESLGKNLNAVINVILDDKLIISGFDNLKIELDEKLLLANNSSSEKILNIDDENRFMSAWVPLLALDGNKIGYILGVSSLKDFDNSIQNTIYSIIKKMSIPYLIMVIVMVFLGKNIATTVKNLQDLRRNLQKQVELKTKEVVEKSYNIKTMLENLKQGIFTILGNGTLDKDYSEHLEQILGTNEIEGKHFNEIFLSRTDLPGDKKNLIENAVIMTIGERELTYEANSHVLPRECTYIKSDNKKADIEVDWNPIILEDTDTIEKIMVTIRDVSEFKKLQEKAKKQEFELNVVAEILTSQPETAKSALETIKTTAKYGLEQFENKNRSIDSADLLRKMHTIKGLSRMVGFTFISEEIHNIESKLIKYFKNYSRMNHRDMEKQLQEFYNVSEVYEEILNTKIINFIDNSKRNNSVEKKYLFQLSKKLKNSAKEKNLGEAINDILQDIEKEIYCNFEEIIADVLSSGAGTAKSLGKKEPVFKTKDGPLKFYVEDKRFVNSLFVHLISNSIDHGLEKPEEREKVSKPLAGVISINLREINNQIEIIYFDDGRGLNLNKIKKIGIEMGLIKNEKHLSSAELSELIFKDGFSTKDELSLVSGRGIGISAVKKELEDSGGSIAIKIKNVDSNNHAHVNFLIRIPISDNFQVSYRDRDVHQTKAS